MSYSKNNFFSCVHRKFAIDTNEWSVSRLGRFNFGGIVTGTRCAGGWVGSKLRLDVFVKGKFGNRKWGPESPIS